MPIFAGRILYQDEQFLAVSKLSGELVVQGSGPMGKLSLLDFLRKQYPDLHPIHRLDFETSGVVLFAKGRKVLKKVMDTNFIQWVKTYRTIVAGRLARDKGSLTMPLPARMGEGNVPATTRYRVLERFALCTYIEADITTGRHHQIRRHFAGISHPLVLDEEYGNKKQSGLFRQRYGYRRFFLHAWRLTFPHPMSGKTVAIEAPMPKVFEEALEKLRHEVH